MKNPDKMLLTLVAMACVVILLSAAASPDDERYHELFRSMMLSPEEYDSGKGETMQQTFQEAPKKFLRR